MFESIMGPYVSIQHTFTPNFIYHVTLIYDIHIILIIFMMVALIKDVQENFRFDPLLCPVSLVKGFV